jgi:hypothetical protein
MLVRGCPMDRRAKLMLSDFEEDTELDRLQWQCLTLFPSPPGTLPIAKNTENETFSLKVAWMGAETI